MSLPVYRLSYLLYSIQVLKFVQIAPIISMALKCILSITILQIEIFFNVVVKSALLL